MVSNFSLGTGVASAKGAKYDSRWSHILAWELEWLAPKARNMIARGKRRAPRGASPLVSRNQIEKSTESAKYDGDYFALSELHNVLRFLPRGDALRLPLAIIFCALGAIQVVP